MLHSLTIDVSICKGMGSRILTVIGKALFLEPASFMKYPQHLNFYATGQAKANVVPWFRNPF